MEIKINNSVTSQELAQLGDGQVAYLKQMLSDDLTERFPQLSPIASGIKLWGLFGASGEPIVLSDVRSTALESAIEHELQTVSLH